MRTYAVRIVIYFTAEEHLEHSYCITPFIQIQQTRKGLPNADINNCIAGIHKVSKHKHIAFKLFLYKSCLCRSDAKSFILRMVQYHNKRLV